MYDLAHWQWHRWEKDTRYYVAEVRQDLFGAWQIARSWGRIASAQGRTTTETAADYTDALALLARTATRRQQRGYVERNPNAEPL